MSLRGFLTFTGVVAALLPSCGSGEDAITRVLVDAEGFMLGEVGVALAGQVINGLIERC